MSTPLEHLLREEIMRLRQRISELEAGQTAAHLHPEVAATALSSGNPNRKVVEEFIDAINRQDWQRYDQLVSPEFVRHSSTFGQSQITSREQLRDYLMGEYQTFPDAFERINFLVCEGDLVVVHSHCYATQMGSLGPFAPKGRTLSADLISIYRVAQGRIVEAWVEWDCLNGLIQLGHMDPPET